MTRGVVLKKKKEETPFQYQTKRKTVPNSSNKVSIRLQEFQHWNFPFHRRLLTSSANLRVASTSVRSQPCFNVIFCEKVWERRSHYTPAHNVMTKYKYRLTNSLLSNKYGVSF